MINAKTSEIALIKRILHAHVPNCEVRVFGSRINQTSRQYSDLDLVIVGKSKIPREILFAIQAELTESSLPYRVDILDWNRISPEFRAIIEERYEVL